MKRQALTGICALAAAGIASTALAGGRVDKILEFDTMVGVDTPFLRGDNRPIHGVLGGGVPWKLTSAQGELTVDGKLEIRVTGLVITSTGVNPIANFRATVSCITPDGVGDPPVENVQTDSFPASTSGDAYIEAQLELPKPCIAPVIFVTSPTGAWFAATGM